MGTTRRTTTPAAGGVPGVGAVVSAVCRVTGARGISTRYVTGAARTRLGMVEVSLATCFQRRGHSVRRFTATEGALLPTLGAFRGAVRPGEEGFKRGPCHDSRPTERGQSCASAWADDVVLVRTLKGSARPLRCLTICASRGGPQTTGTERPTEGHSPSLGGLGPSEEAFWLPF